MCVSVSVCVYVCICICMCVCVHLRVHRYLYVCMCVCMHVCMYVCMYLCMHVCMHACMYVCMYVRMYVCMYVCMYVYMCVSSGHACMHVYVFFSYMYRSTCVRARIGVLLPGHDAFRLKKRKRKISTHAYSRASRSWRIYADVLPHTFTTRCVSEGAKRNAKTRHFEE